MPRQKGSRVIDGKVVMPTLVAEIADQEQKPIDLVKPAEPTPVPHELAMPAPRSEPIRLKFGHEGEDLNVIIWQGNKSTTAKVPAMLIMTQPKGRVVEASLQILVDAINAM